MKKRRTRCTYCLELTLEELDSNGVCPSCVPERKAAVERDEAEEKREEQIIQYKREIVKQGKRVLAKQHHPDLGGNREQMELVNEAAKSLEESL